MFRGESTLKSTYIVYTALCNWSKYVPIIGEDLRTRDLLVGTPELNAITPAI